MPYPAHGYNAAHSTLGDTRSREYALFAQVTSTLIASQSADFPTKAAALHQNSKLWNTLAADLANTNNQLPRDLRARLFFLAEFTFSLTKDALSNNTDFTALIDINKAIMLGLTDQSTPLPPESGAP